MSFHYAPIHGVLSPGMFYTKVNSTGKVRPYWTIIQGDGEPRCSVRPAVKTPLKYGSIKHIQLFTVVILILWGSSGYGSPFIATVALAAAVSKTDITRRK